MQSPEWIEVSRVGLLGMNSVGMGKLFVVLIKNTMKIQLNHDR